MATIITRAGKGSPLTFAEVDANFTNLNTDKIDAPANYVTAPVKFSSLRVDYNNIAGASFTVNSTGLAYNISTASTVSLPGGSSEVGRLLLFRVNQTGATLIASNPVVIPLTGGSPQTNILPTATVGKFALLQYNGTNWITMMAN